MKKENMGLKITIGILVVVVIGLVGYIIYDKKADNKVKEPVKQEENSNNDNNKVENNNQEDYYSGDTYPDKLENIDSSKLKEFVAYPDSISRTIPSIKDFDENPSKAIDELLSLYKIPDYRGRSIIFLTNDKEKLYNYNGIVEYERDNARAGNLFYATDCYITGNNEYQNELKEYVDDMQSTAKYVVPKKLYEKAYHELWGEDKKVSYELCGKITDFGGTIAKENYIIIDTGGSGFVGPQIDDIMAIDKFEKIDDTLVVYIKYLSFKIREDSSDLKWNVYKDSLQEDLIAENVYLDAENDDEYLQMYNDKCGKYKLTFKKSANDKYYWDSTLYLG